MAVEDAEKESSVASAGCWYEFEAMEEREEQEEQEGRGCPARE